MIEKYKINHLIFSNINWEYISHGDSNKVILFLNGGLRFAESASHYIKILGDNFRIIIPTYPPIDNVDEMVIGINEILKKEKIEKKVIVIGQSYGGMIAQVFSLKYPDKVGKLILNSTASIFINTIYSRIILIFLLIFLKIPAKWIRNIYTKNLLRALKLNKANNEDWIKYAKKLIDTKLTNNHIYSHFLTAKDTLIKYSDKKKVNKYNGNVLIVNGETDKFSTAKDHKKLLEDYPNSDSKIINKAGHIVILDEPEEYKRLINKFVNKQCTNAQQERYKKLPEQ